MKAKKEFITKLNRISRDVRLYPKGQILVALIWASLNSENDTEKVKYDNLLDSLFVKRMSRLSEEDSLSEQAPTTRIEQSAGAELKDMLHALGFKGTMPLDKDDEVNEADFEDDKICIEAYEAKLGPHLEPDPDSEPEKEILPVV